MGEVTSSEYGEVLDTRKVFFKVAKKESGKLFFGLLFSLVWGYVSLKSLPDKFLSSELGFYFTILPLVVLIFWIVIIYLKIREAFWKQLALKYGWEYTFTKDLTAEKALLFSIGHSRSAPHGITGRYNNQPFHIFEYDYSIGQGKGRTDYSFTVFEVKFTGTFPHLYLNYKNNGYSNTPAMFSSLAKISVPREFENGFKLYSPKEYEIETLEIFTPDIFSLLLDSKWDHDMEFVDGELVIYGRKKFHNFADLDAELNKIKKFVDILSPLLNRLKLTQIGDISPLLRN